MYHRLHKGGVKIPYTHRAGLGTQAIVAGFWRSIPLRFGISCAPFVSVTILSHEFPTLVSANAP